MRACSPIQELRRAKARRGTLAGFWEEQRSGWILAERDWQRRLQKRAVHDDEETDVEGQRVMRGDSERGVVQNAQAREDV